MIFGPAPQPVQAFGLPLRNWNGRKNTAATCSCSCFCLGPCSYHPAHLCMCGHHHSLWCSFWLPFSFLQPRRTPSSFPKDSTPTTATATVNVMKSALNRNACRCLCHTHTHTCTFLHWEKFAEKSLIWILGFIRKTWIFNFISSFI